MPLDAVSMLAPPARERQAGSVGVDSADLEIHKACRQPHTAHVEFRVVGGERRGPFRPDTPEPRVSGGSPDSRSVHSAGRAVPMIPILGPSGRSRVVDRMGLEPTTSALRTLRSPN